MSLRSAVGATLRQWDWWRTLRRVQAEGVGHAYHRWGRFKQALATPPVRTDAVGRSPVELHLLCHRADYLCAIWALKTLYVTSGVHWPLVIHLQGAASSLMVQRLRRHLPDARLIFQEEADAVVQSDLASDHPRLMEARQTSAFMMKLIDLVHLSRSEQVVILDSDVLFFRDPVELRAHVERAPAETWLFQRDPVSQYNVAEDVAASEFGIRMPKQVNSGIAVVPRALVDLRLCERLLAHSEVRRPTGWIEQTLFALCAGARGRVEYLPSSYVVSLDRGLDHDSFTARHFAGPSRPLLADEGMPYAALKRCLG